MNVAQHERAATAVLVSYIRWAGVGLGIVQAFLTTDPQPIGGPWIVLAVTAVMAAYNVLAGLIPRLPGRLAERLILATLVGDFLVCTAWTLLNADDIYSTTYAIYTLVAIEAAVLYQWRGSLVFTAGFVVAYAVLYWQRAYYFGFPILLSSILYRSMIVLMAATFTGAITNQSQRRRAAAEAASQAKSEHLSRMSHELRTPLTAIMGYAELLELELPPAQRRKVEAILAASSHLLDMVNDVLDISRTSAGHTSDALETVDLAAAADECIAILGPRAELRGIAITTHYPHGVPRHVIADRKWLHQVVLNLLSNAINYNRVGGDILISTNAGGDGMVRLAIEDSGPGIDPIHLDALWQPFERLGAERTSVEGTGLGLSLCKRLVEAMSGTIGVATQVGEGSTFWVEIPVAHAAVAAADSVAQPAALVGHRTPTSDSPTVLVVEDDPATLGRYAEAESAAEEHSVLHVAQLGEGAGRP
jgi:signal transduction histidine kinase